MRLVQTTDMLGDETYWLQATDIPNGLMLEDAIRWIVSLNRNEFGSIYLGTSGRKEIATYHHCEITNEDSVVISQHQGKDVEKIEANGGWGQMNYYITLK